MLNFSLGGGVKPSSNATFHGRVRRFYESIKKKCRELSLVNSETTNNKQVNYNNVNSQLSWIIASLGQVAHFTSVVIRNNNNPNSQHTTHNSLVKAIAFTLAETLVVMGIIGVVAALTIPNLNQSTGDREKIAKVKKIYSNLEDAFGRATAVYGPYDTWLNGLSTDEEMATRKGQRLTEFIKVSKDCGYVTEDNNTCLKPYVETYSIITADGTGIGFYGGGAYGDNGLIYVDIDGINKGKNNSGFDTFWFELTNEGVIPRGCEQSTLMASGRYDNATCWIIQNGNMDYLKTDSQGKCPNGTTLDWTTNTSCK